ncbi:MAG: pilus assembly protein [Deltaproteobacteria bacterium]|nr:pilus assembly protein [Deltaproteobacteria bacterium]
MKASIGVAIKFNKQFHIPMSGFWLRSEGVTALEAALMIPVFLLCVCGIVDFGNIYLKWQLVSDAAREGARFAALSTANDGPGTNQSAVQNVIQTKYNNNSLSLTMTPNIVYPGSGQPITVNVSETVSILTPLVRPFFNHDPSVQGQSTMLSQ